MILIGCPVHNRAGILANYLDVCRAQDYDGDVSFYFIANNCTDDTVKILDWYDVCYKVVDNPDIMPDKRIKQDRRSTIYSWLATLRNAMLDKAISIGADFFLSCDSDIIMRPDALSRLVAHNVPAVSSLVYNGYLVCPEEPQKYPNILKWDGTKYVHQTNWYIKNNIPAPYGKIIATDFTGACILIRKDMFKYRYGYYYQGEDEPFCRSVRAHGLYCDISVFSHHIMGGSL